MQNKTRWIVFFGGLTAFVAGVEVWHRHVKDKDSVYQCRILIDKDFSIEESSPEEEVKSEKISLYTRTRYGVLPRKQSDPSKIFRAYSANPPYLEEGDKYVKLAVVVQNATRESVQNVIAAFPNEKISFVIPYYVMDLNNIAEIIISSGHEFFVQLPTQTSIPADRKETVSPFLANASAEEMQEKLSYLMASVKYAIGIANTSDSLITKSRKDMSIIARELSERGMAFLNITDDSDVMEEISSRIKLLSLKADLFNADNIAQGNSKNSIIVKSEQLDKLKEILPKDIKIVPISYGVLDASV